MANVSASFSTVIITDVPRNVGCAMVASLPARGTGPAQTLAAAEETANDLAGPVRPTVA
ncbi:MAG: hypothetical protein GX875_04300 [Propionibacterium sp.]|nr:hypothetical protein [Propionibacterium sp.]